MSDASPHLAMPAYLAMPASCSGFNLFLIAAYSYIVNPDLDTSKRLAADTGAETPKSAARFFFICTSFLHLED